MDIASSLIYMLVGLFIRVISEVGIVNNGVKKITVLK